MTRDSDDNLEDLSFVCQAQAKGLLTQRLVNHDRHPLIQHTRPSTRTSIRVALGRLQGERDARTRGGRKSHLYCRLGHDLSLLVGNR